MQAHMASLFWLSSIPSKETLITDLTRENILTQSSETVQKLFHILENSPTVDIRLCEEVGPLLDSLETSEEEGSESLKVYVDQLRKCVHLSGVNNP